LKSGKPSADSDQTTESIALDIQTTYALIDKAVKKMKKNQNVLSIKQINELPLMQAYRLLLSNRILMVHLCLTFSVMIAILIIHQKC